MKRACLRIWPLLLGAAVAGAAPAPRADPPATAPTLILPLGSAVHFALENNPQLAVVRTQRGLARAGVVLSRIYPYNPVLNSVILGVTGPADSGITNHVFNEHY